MAENVVELKKHSLTCPFDVIAGDGMTTLDMMKLNSYRADELLLESEIYVKD